MRPSEDMLLEVEDLSTCFMTRKGAVPSVHHVSFSLAKGETLAIVGESGCGKSVTSLSIMRLVPHPGQIVGGRILFHGQDLLQLSEQEMRKIRGNRISMIFQEPMTSLNPVLTIGDQISEVFRLHRKLDKRSALERSEQMLEMVGIPNPKKVARSYPHELSGGMRQRVMIAIALACEPELLIADEPTTALDVTIQAQILELMNRLIKEKGTGMIMITHDLGVVAEIADRVIVMYAGEIVEEAPVRDIFANPGHPYTIGLLRSLPGWEEDRDELYSIPGTVPNLLEKPPGCVFHPRCPWATDECRALRQEMQQIGKAHAARCMKAKEIKEGRHVDGKYEAILDS